MAKCYAKHVPESDRWQCPICKSETDFVIDETQDDADEDCDLLHPNDLCTCYSCGFSEIGMDVSEWMMGKRVECPHCKGIGWTASS